MKLVYILAAIGMAIGAFFLGTTRSADNMPVAIKPVTAQTEASLPTLVRGDGSYPVKPLAKDVIVVKVLQTTVNSLQDFPTIEEGLEFNLKHMEDMADKACTTGKKPDFLLYHEFPLTGYSSGGRAEKLKFTVEIPGPESERIAKIARDCDTYVIFGSYATNADWPGHILSLNTVINREGEIAKVFWKSRNIKRLYPDREIMTTTIEAVRDKYRDMYGPEEEFPVLQTEFGNIAVSTVQVDPFVFMSFAMRGTEVMFRTATLYDIFDVQSMAKHMNVYSAMANFALPLNPKYDAGESVIVAPNGDILAKSDYLDKDDIIEAEIPIAEHRRGRKIPNYAYDMTVPVLEQYVQEFPINHLDIPRTDLPETGEAMKALMEDVSRFKAQE